MQNRPDEKQYIKIRGANEHNLKNIDLDIPRNELVVLTGLSGSGKSSLAFDTIYAEGQRRYMESLSSYARQFLGQMEKPNVESIEGLSPAISIDRSKPAKQTLSAKVISKYCQTPVSSLMNRQQESISSLSNVLKQTARPTAISTQSIRTATAVK